MSALSLTRTKAFVEKHFTTPAISSRDAMQILLPLLVENAFITLFGVINTSMISSAGMNQLSAVSLVDSLNMVLQTFYLGMATGASVVVAGYRGRGEKALLHESSTQAVTLVTGTAIIVTAIMIALAGPVLSGLFGEVSPEVMSLSVFYMLGGALTLPFMAASNAIGGVLRGIGEGRKQLLITIINSVMYIALNIIFLMVLKLGITGLLISITINRVAGLGVSLTVMKLTNSEFTIRFRELFHINIGIIKKMLFIGFPAVIEQVFFTGGKLLMQRFVVPLGTDAIAAYNISFSIVMFTQIASNSIGSALYTFTGINLGAGRRDDIKPMTMAYSIFSIALHVIALVLFVTLFNVVILLYNATPEVKHIVYICSMGLVLIQPFTASFAFIFPTVFRAAGDGVYCTVVSLIIMWVCRVGGGYLFGVILGYGVVGVWAGMIVDWIARAIVFGLRYRGEKWFAKCGYLSK